MPDYGSAGTGETNTASNVGTAGTGVFKQKTGVNLEFKKINSDTTITITDDIANSEVDIERAALTGDVTASAGSNTTAIGAGVIVDADINASGITTRSKLPSAIAYEDEANTFSATTTLNGINIAQVAKTGNYTLTSTDIVIKANASAGAFTLTLPTASGITGRIYTIVRIDIDASTNILTIDANGSETIEGILTWRLMPGEKLVIQSDGTNWIVLYHDHPSQHGYYFRKNSTENRMYISDWDYTANGMGTSTSSPAANTLWALPFIVSRVTKFDEISFEITTAQASQNARVGAYYDNGNCAPGVLIFDSGNISTGTTGVKSFSIPSANQIFQPGLYWLAWVTSATTCQVRIIPGGTQGYGINGFLDSDWGAVPSHGYTVAHTFGALPDPYGTPTYMNTNPSASNPVIALALRAV